MPTASHSMNGSTMKLPHMPAGMGIGSVQPATFYTELGKVLVPSLFRFQGLLLYFTFSVLKQMGKLLVTLHAQYSGCCVLNVTDLALDPRGGPASYTTATGKA